MRRVRGVVGGFRRRRVATLDNQVREPIPQLNPDLLARDRPHVVRLDRRHGGNRRKKGRNRSGKRAEKRFFGHRSDVLLLVMLMRA